MFQWGWKKKSAGIKRLGQTELVLSSVCGFCVREGERGDAPQAHVGNHQW